ncbi:MAG: insulinase family protein [bacterium]|nr:insulinase family protein [bacterium]
MRVLRLSMKCVIAVMLLLVAAYAPARASSGAVSVTRATLSNGLQVVVVHDPLAPVVTAVLNYRVGSNEQRYPGQAHALEHMMFRGSASLSESQLADISELLGGDSDADTQAEITQYFFSAPSQYLDLVLRMEASRMRGAFLSQKDWNIEKGAITQEVTQDQSNWVWRLLDHVSTALYAGTPYQKDGLGNVQTFAHVIDHANLAAFYNTWYHPNNAVYVIAGNVDGASTIALVKKYFGAFKRAPLPKRPAVTFKPVTKHAVTIDSDLPVDIDSVAFRLPGWQSKDYAASTILTSVLNSPRSKLYDLVVSGKLLQVQVAPLEAHPLASGTLLLGVTPIGADSKAAIAAMQSVIEEYKKTGVPADLVDVAKRRAIAEDAFKANSIQQLAFAWSDAVAAKGLSSPDAEIAALRAVTVNDVNRVLRTYFTFDRALTVYAVPKKGGAAQSHEQPVAKESNKLTIQHHDPLPAWAIAAFKQTRVPAKTISPVDMTLANGMRVIVVPEHVSDTVAVVGNIATNEAMEASKNVQGVADMASALFQYGTTTYDRVAFQTQLDDIAANVSAGTAFSMSSLASDFDRGVQLLADDELHPAFPAQNFAVVKAQNVASMPGVIASPDYKLGIALNAALYPAGDPSRIVPTLASVGSITLDDVKKWYATAYRPDMTTVVVIGDVTPERVKATFEKYFGAWTATGPKPDVALPAVPNNKPADVVVPDPTRVQSQVEYTQTNALTRDNPDWAALAVANAAFGSGGSSILFHDVRDLHGLVYGIGSNFDAGKNRGSFGLYFASDPAKIDAAQSLAFADLKALMTHGMTPDDLARGKAMLVSRIPLRQESFGGIAGQLIGYAQLGLPLDHYVTEAKAEVETTNHAIVSALQKWVRPADFVRVILGPAPK